MTTILDTEREIARLREEIATMQDQVTKLARTLPPLPIAEVGKLVDRDRTLEADVMSFMSKFFDRIDVTLLSEDVEAWERLRSGQHDRFRVVEHAEDRFEVRELEDGPGFGVWDRLANEIAERFDITDTYGLEASREDAKEYARERNENVYWTVRDTDYTGSDPVDDRVFDDSDDAQTLADEKNADEDVSTYGFPFAASIGWCYREGDLPESWLVAMEGAGFLVYRYVGPKGEDDAIIAGIDGGGYSFIDAHYAPFYATLAARNNWLIETMNGPRTVTP